MCLRATHVLGGAYAGAGFAWAQGQPWWVLAASAAIAAGTAPLPDVDQHGPWKTADHLLPDELLGNQGPMRHRGITHWWGLPVAATAVLAVAAPGWWPAWALLVGWASHLLLDFIWGRPGYGRGPGIPTWPWWGHVGLGLDTGGWSEAVFRWLLGLAPAALLIHAATT